MRNKFILALGVPNNIGGDEDEIWSPDESTSVSY